MIFFFLLNPLFTRAPSQFFPHFEEVFRLLSTRTARTSGNTETNGCREVGLGEGGETANRVPPPLPHQLFPLSSQKKTTTDSARLHRAQVAPPPPPPSPHTPPTRQCTSGGQHRRHCSRHPTSRMSTRSLRAAQQPMRRCSDRSVRGQPGHRAIRKPMGAGK